MPKIIKRLLITGGTGFIGKNLINHLSGKYQIVTIVRDPRYKKSDVKTVYGDISDKRCVYNAVKDVDVVVHLAAILNPFDENIKRVNVDSTKFLVEAAKMHKVKKFIFISTENVLFDFDDAYSTTKMTAEDLVKSIDNYLIIRPTTVFGEYDERYIKRLVDMVKKYKTVIVPESKKLFQPVYVEDVVKCIENGIKYDVKGEYVVAGPSKISYNDFTDIVLKELRFKKRVIRLPLWLLKLADYINKNFLKTPKLRFFQVKSLGIDKVYDIKKSKKALRYNPTPLIVGIRKTLKFLKS